MESWAAGWHPRLPIGAIPGADHSLPAAERLIADGRMLVQQPPRYVEGSS